VPSLVIKRFQAATLYHISEKALIKKKQGSMAEREEFHHAKL